MVLLCPSDPNDFRPTSCGRRKLRNLQNLRRKAKKVARAGNCARSKLAALISAVADSRVQTRPVEIFPFDAVSGRRLIGPADFKKKQPASRLNIHAPIPRLSPSANFISGAPRGRRLRRDAACGRRDFPPERGKSGTGRRRARPPPRKRERSRRDRSIIWPAVRRDEFAVEERRMGT